MLDVGVIQPAWSELASPVVFVPKPNENLGFCVDYSGLNALTVKYIYSLSRINECIDCMGDDQFFTTFKCNSGYWRLSITAKDQYKTTVTCHN